MTKRIIIGVVAVIIAIVVFGIVILPALAPAFSATLGGQAYNDETPIGAAFQFMNPDGMEITHVEITISWTATGTDIDTATFSVSGSVTCSISGVVVKTISIAESGSDKMVSSYVCVFTMEECISEQRRDEVDPTWDLIFNGHLDATITDVNGDTIDSDVDTNAVTYTVSWSTGTFSIDASIGI